MSKLVLNDHLNGLLVDLSELPLDVCIRPSYVLELLPCGLQRSPHLRLIDFACLQLALLNLDLAVAV